MAAADEAPNGTISAHGRGSPSSSGRRHATSAGNTAAPAGPSY